jgi:peptide deformylase
MSIISRAMAILPIHVIPDAVLRAKAEPIAEVDDALRRLMDDMVETMYAAPGIGLAAPQVGKLIRLTVIDVSREDEERAPLFLVNPEITWRSEERSVYEEGCLSIPDYFEEVERPARVRAAFLDRYGKPQEIEAAGVLATCVQHEIDHLDGILFLDHISRLKREMVWKRFAKAAKRDGGPTPIVPTGEKKPRTRRAPRPAEPDGTPHAPNAGEL